MPRRKQILDGIQFLATTLLVVFGMRTVAFASYYIPTESMVPTLQIGDRVLVSKWNYGYSRHSLPIDPGVSLPGKDGRVFMHLPERGDVVVFTHPKTGETLIKRVIGLAGDRIAMHHGRLFINGKMVARKEMGHYSYRGPYGRVISVTRYDETLPGGDVHPIIERSDRGMADEMAQVTVPPGDLFMMGDNRDDSADSRFAELGFVPVENLIGRADMIAYSLYACRPEKGLHCASDRWVTRVP